MKPFINVHIPRHPGEVIGQEGVISQLTSFIQSHKNQRKKAVVIYGPSGVGKTSSVYAIANQHNLEVVEVNASDFRNADKINQVLGSAIKQQSLFSAGKIILVDEIDGLSGAKDRGGIQAVVKLIKQTTFPIVLTATNPYDKKFSTLRSNSTLMEFKELEYTAIHTILKTICDKEKIGYEDAPLKTLARRAGGDARAAINNLQSISSTKGKVNREAIEDLSDRDKRENILQALSKVLKTTDLKIALNAYNSIDEDYKEILLWLDENVPKEYKNPEDLANAYEAMSRADVFSGRIRRWQHYRFLVYINALLSGGISVAKKEKYPGFVDYKPTGRILKLWWAKQKNMKKKAIAEKIARKTHTSTKEVIKNTFPYFLIMFNSDKNAQEQFIDELDLDKDQVMWLKKNKVLTVSF